MGIFSLIISIHVFDRTIVFNIKANTFGNCLSSFCFSTKDLLKGYNHTSIAQLLRLVLTRMINSLKHGIQKHQGNEEVELRGFHLSKEGIRTIIRIQYHNV